jgi:hypothetical protein
MGNGWQQTMRMKISRLSRALKSTWSKGAIVPIIGVIIAFLSFIVGDLIPVFIDAKPSREQSTVFAPSIAIEVNQNLRPDANPEKLITSTRLAVDQGITSENYTGLGESSRLENTPSTANEPENLDTKLLSSKDSLNYVYKPTYDIEREPVSARKVKIDYLDLSANEQFGGTEE